MLHTNLLKGEQSEPFPTSCARPKRFCTCLCNPGLRSYQDRSYRICARRSRERHYAHPEREAGKHDSSGRRIPGRTSDLRLRIQTGLENRFKKGRQRQDRGCHLDREGAALRIRRVRDAWHKPQRRGKPGLEVRAILRGRNEGRVYRTRGIISTFTSHSSQEAQRHCHGIEVIAFRGGETASPAITRLEDRQFGNWKPAQLAPGDAGTIDHISVTGFRNPMEGSLVRRR